MQEERQEPPAFLRIREVCRRTALSKTSVYDLEKSGQFPRRRNIGGRAVAWLESEVSEWIAARPTAQEVQQ